MRRPHPSFGRSDLSRRLERVEYARRAACPAPKRTGSSAASPVSASAARDGGRAPRRRARPRVLSATHATRALRRGQRDRLVQRDQLCERRQRVPGVALDLRRPGLVAEHERVRRARRGSSPSVTPGVGRMDDRALPLDEQQLAPALAALDDEPLRRAGDEVRDDRVDGDPPARDRDPGLARSGRTPTRARARARPGRARARRSSSRSRSPSRR